MITFIKHLEEKLRGSFWTIPSLLGLVAILLSFGSLWIDQRFGGVFFAELSWLKLASPEGARALLGTIATSMLAITGVAFSSIMVTLTLASQQFGPRLLRNFMRDNISQTLLGTLIATFIYCILVMRATSSNDGAQYAPQFSVLIALILSIVCLGTFIKFIHHIATNIQAENVVADSYAILRETVTNIFPEPDDESKLERGECEPINSWNIRSTEYGYVQVIDQGKLVSLASEFDLTLKLCCRAGHFVSDGQVIIEVLSDHEKEGDKDKVIGEILSCFYFGKVRTQEQDYEYGIRQLVEIALRALSPGINDPFTAINCIDYLGAGMQYAFNRALPPSVHQDKQGVTRLYSWEIDYRDLVEASVNQVRQAGSERCDVSCQILEMLCSTAKQSPLREQQLALSEQARLTLSDSLPQMQNDHDRDAIQSRYDQFVKSCHHLANHS
ncbi:MAG: DUF2254 domain-containing protein [Akkermansiaceae bacterium]